MTIRTLLVAATLCGIVTLSGCAAKEAAKIDLAPPSTTMATAPDSPTGIEKAAGSIVSDSVLTESIPTAGGETEQNNDANKGIRLATVYFDYDSYLLSVDARNTLTRNARWLKENRFTRVIIEGHSDERGSDDYNLALAEKRAIAALRYLETLGVNQVRMEAISYGEEKPAVIGHDEAVWAKNRRVEFAIVK